MQKVLLLLVVLSTTLAAYSQNSKRDQIDALITAYTKIDRFNGSVLVAVNDQVVLAKGYGLQNAATRQANSAEGIFQIYSVTKTFTSVVVMRLEEQGKLALTDQLSKYFPDFPSGDSITLTHLLSHTSGIHDHTQDNLPDPQQSAVVAFLKTRPLEFPPGQGWNYSNSNYFLLGYIIEQVTGLPYEKAVEQYVFQPLGMSHSGFAFKNLQNPLKTTGYAYLNASGQLEAEVYAPPGPYAAGAIYSTVGDLYKYYQGLQANKILRRETLLKASTPVANGYGLGWISIPLFGQQLIGHSGGAAGYRSLFTLSLDAKICVVLLGNTETDLNNLSKQIYAILFDQPYKIPTDLPLSATQLAPLTGTYVQEGGLTIYVRTENGKLVAQPSRQGAVTLLAERPDYFYVEEIDGYLQFAANASGRVDTLRLIREGQPMPLLRVAARWGLIGSVTDSGWDGADLPLTQDPEHEHIWRIRSVALATGEFKFRFNNDWTINLGLRNTPSLLGQDGTNLRVETSGVYDITLDLSAASGPVYNLVRVE